MIINLHINRYLLVLKKETDVIPDYCLQIYQTDLRSIFCTHLWWLCNVMRSVLITISLLKILIADIVLLITGSVTKNDDYLRFHIPQRGFQIDCYYYFSLFLYRYSFEDWKLSNVMKTLLYFFAKTPQNNKLLKMPVMFHLILEI